MWFLKFFKIIIIKLNYWRFVNLYVVFCNEIMFIIKSNDNSIGLLAIINAL